MTEIKTEPTIQISIYMAGDIGQAKQVCREFCFAEGFCVHIEPVDYIFTGGEETGFRVGIIHYPRFPSSELELMQRAEALADFLMKRLCQHSYSIVGPTKTVWHSRKPA